MAKNAYIGVGSVARKIKQPYVGVGGVARKIKNSYIGVGGVARQFFQGGTPVSSLAVGSSVYMNVNGVSKEFLVVHQGNPNTSIYDSSCNGTWLLMKDCYEERAWHSTNYNDYENSTIHSYLNGTFLGLFDSNVQTIIKQVKIPYWKGTGTAGSLATGSSGLSTKIFLTTYQELGYAYDGVGDSLSYFSSATGNSDRLRMAYYDGEEVMWWMRAPSTSNSTYAAIVRWGGSLGSIGATQLYGVRPLLILPSTAVVNENKQVVG